MPFTSLDNPNKGGPTSPQWKGGRKNRRGYILIWKPEHPFADCQGYVLEHRLVWEKHNNAILLPWSDVHHINDIRNDNRIENLKAMSHTEHTIITHVGKKYSKSIMR